MSRCEGGRWEVGGVLIARADLAAVDPCPPTDCQIARGLLGRPGARGPGDQGARGPGGQGARGPGGQGARGPGGQGTRGPGGPGGQGVVAKGVSGANVQGRNILHPKLRQTKKICTR